MKDVYKILGLFTVWRLSLFIFASIASLIIPQFGARFPYYRSQLIVTYLPDYIWSFGNFDGVHYLRIAESGYTSEYSQAFFPLYPLLIKLFSFGLPFNLKANLLVSGLLLSNIFAVLALFLIYKLFKLDFNDNISYKSILLLLSFPTAFYLGAVYTESLFLLLISLSFLLLRKNQLFLSAIVIGISTATRVFGILMIPLLIYYLYKSKYPLYKSFLLVGISISGICVYMIYLGVNFGDPLYFLTAQPAFGAQRTSSQLVLLPQVLFRYLKIFMTVDFKTIIFLNALLEFILTVGSILIVLFARKVINKQYIYFALSSLIMPTLTGTLSSMPRYSLMTFLVFPSLVINLRRFFYPFCLLLFLLQIVLMIMFVRGHWIS